jgi:outer membrane protein W
MKKVLLAMVIVSSISLGAKAQSKFSLGPTAGFGSTTISNLNNSKFKAAAAVGLSSVYSAAEHFGIGLDVKYSFEGAKTSTPEMEWDIHYLRIPLKAIYFFGDYGNKVRPKIFAGPSFGILSSSKVNDVDVKSSTESFDFGALGGVGLNIRMVKNTWFNTDLTYTHGIKEVNPTADYSNRNLMLNVGVNFGL